MSTTTKNGAVVPTGSDPYALTADLRKMMESAGLVFPVTSQAQRDAIPEPARGMVVLRLDRLGAAEFWSGQAWIPAAVPLPPMGHLGKTNGYTPAKNGVVPMTDAQYVRGSVRVSQNALVVPKAGFYDLRFKVYMSGGTGSHTAVMYVNDVGSGVAAHWNKSQAEEQMAAAGVRQLAAGDKVTLVTTGSGNVWGGDGYNGTWMEVVYVGPAENY